MARSTPHVDLVAWLLLGITLGAAAARAIEWRR